MSFKKIFTWVIGIGFIFYVAALVWWFTWRGINPTIFEIILKQWLAVIVFPSACFAALVAVMVLDQAVGNIEFKALGFEFKGAAAPIVMWAMLILVLGICFHLLWQP
jgi:hypothetical protein